MTRLLRSKIFGKGSSDDVGGCESRRGGGMVDLVGFRETKELVFVVGKLVGSVLFFFYYLIMNHQSN